MESFLWTFIQACLVIFLGHFALSCLLFPDRLPSSLPWTGLRKEIFAKTRASFRQLTGNLETLLDGYTNVPYHRFLSPFHLDLLLIPGATAQ